MEKNIAKNSFELRLLYTLAGVTGAMGFALVLYWSLRLNSSIATLIESTATSPLYIWLYAALTLATIILFGINVGLFVRNWRFFGKPSLRSEAGTTLGGIVSIFASACPTCGSILLSALGITSGLLAFPLAGLELKILALILMGVSVWLSVRSMKKRCSSAECALPPDSFKKSDKKWIALCSIAVVLMALVVWNIFNTESAIAKTKKTPVATVSADPNSPANVLFARMMKDVTPNAGWHSQIALRDAIVTLVRDDVINAEKVRALYGSAGTPQAFTDIMTKPDDKPIVLTQANASYYLNALWALGLANHMETNRTSPVVGAHLFDFASTGGWTLGGEENGGAYFNKFPIVALTREQEALVRSVAENTYRPCCDNSSFYQDCNHGSAILGLLELGVSQGLDEAALYREALHFNTFWFPESYIETAMHFKTEFGIEWKDIDARLVMSKFYSSASGWYKNVLAPLKAKELVPSTAVGGTGC